MAVIILAGGLSIRMGRDKAHLEMNGSNLLQSLVMQFSEGVGPVIIVRRPGQDVDVKGTLLVEDIYQGTGPLGGLHAGLLATPDDSNFLLACDMPFADPRLACHLIDRSDGYDAVVPMLQRGPEPLHAVYRRSCLPWIETNLQSGLYKMRFLLDKVKTLYVPEEDIRQIDPELRSFLNVNTPEDYDLIIGS